MIGRPVLCWIASLETILIEKKLLTKEEVDRKVAELEAKRGEPFRSPACRGFS